MEDPVLNRNLDETKELYTRWRQFHEFFKMAIKGENITPQAEMKFLELKTRIAMLHDGFMQSLKHDHKIGQNVLSIMASCIMLRRIPVLSHAEIQKLEFDWNEAFLLMDETIAHLEEEKERLSEISERAWKMRQRKEKLVTSVHNFIVGPYLKAIIALGVIGFVVVGVPMFGIYDYGNLKKDLPWTAVVYDPAVNMIRTVNPDLAYRDLEDIGAGEVDADVYREVQEGKQRLTEDYFVSQLLNYGFTASQVNDVKELLGRKREFGREQWRLLRGRNREPSQMFFILFEDAEDARRFVQLRKDGLQQKQDFERERIEQNVTVGRKANLVVLTKSDEEALRVDLPKTRFGLSDDQINL